MLAFASTGLKSRAETVLEWRFDANLADSSGNALHGTWSGGGTPAYGTGPDGSPCISLDGAHYVRRSTNDAALRLTELTIEAYIKPAEIGGEQNIVDFRQSNGGYDLRLMGDHQAQFTIQLEGANGIGVTTLIGSIPENHWVHVAAARNASGESSIYVNGVLHRAHSGTLNSANTQYPFQVGRPVFTPFPFFFRGLIDHVRVSNSALNPGDFLPAYVDCNDNGLIDSVEIETGKSQDCNQNGAPDVCDMQAGGEDSNNNGIPDECDVLVVTSLGDPGVADDDELTLREAMTMANSIGGLKILFDSNLAGSTIQPLSQLPTLTGGNVTINGDIDGDDAPDIALDGSLANAADGLRIHSAGNTIRGLAIGHFAGIGVRAFGAEAIGNTISFCYVGTDIAGEEARPNASVGIWLQSNTVSTTIGPGNVLGANLQGIAIDGGTGHHVFGNRIGVSKSGITMPSTGGIWIRNGITKSTVGPGNIISANVYEGIVLSDGANANQVHNNVVTGNGSGVHLKAGAFGNSIGPGNLISGNRVEGARFDGPGTVQNVLFQNSIGTNSAGAEALPNGWVGVLIDSGASDNAIGPGNTISGNGSSGILISGVGCAENLVLGNRIGTDVTGAFALGNAAHGISIYNGPQHNRVGGIASGKGNVISGNRLNGIEIGGGSGNSSPTAFNVVEGNLIGTDAAGQAVLPNGIGVVITSGQAPAANNIIGPANVISGNTREGILLEGALDTQLVSNKVGTDVSGLNRLGNGGSGIVVWQGCARTKINGNVAGGGVNLGAAGIVVLGQGTVDTLIERNLIGVGADGTTPISNNYAGIVIADGTESASVRENVVASNVHEGIVVDAASDVKITRNRVGTDNSGLNRLGNGGSGVVVRQGCARTTVNGNVIVGGVNSGAAGIVVLGQETIDTLIEGNFIGVGADGTTPISNNGAGIVIAEGTESASVRENVVASNVYEGIVVDAASDVEITRNRVGTDAAGSRSVGNGGPGIWVRNGSDRCVILENLSSGNGDAGVVIDGGVGHIISRNQLGTDLEGNRPIPNHVGIWVRSGAAEVQIGPENLISGNLYEGIGISGGANGVQIAENFVGTDSHGECALPNGTGINIKEGATGNEIGPGNVISGNSYFGIAVSNPETQRNILRNNLIGLNLGGTSALPNGAPGIEIGDGASDNTIGPGNTISGNGSAGIAISTGAHDNRIVGNRIGTDVTGSLAIPNYWDGIVIQAGAHDNIVGGIPPEDGNLISGNRTSGVLIRGQGSSGNIVLGNRLGTDNAGVSAIPNGYFGDYAHGVALHDGASGNTIGPFNVIAGNRGDGVRITEAGTDGNKVVGNLIGITENGIALRNETGIQIDLGAAGNIIGGHESSGNVISGNVEGIVISDPGTNHNTVVGNIIGMDPAGQKSVRNLRDGVKLWNYHSGPQGGPEATYIAANLIGGNGWDGVFVGNGRFTTISENTFRLNRGRPISMAVGANDDIGTPSIIEILANEVIGATNVAGAQIAELFGGPSEGDLSFLDARQVIAGTFAFPVQSNNWSYLGATVTDAVGNTSRLGTLDTTPGRGLYAIDTWLDALVLLNTDGSGSRIGSLGFDFVRGGLAHRPGGDLFLLNEGGNLYRVDKVRGTAESVGNLGYPDVETACFDSSGWLWVAVSPEVVPEGAPFDLLLRLHPDSLRLEVVGNMGVDIDALVCLPDDRLLGVDTGLAQNGLVFSTLYSIERASGAATFNRSLGDLNIVGAAYDAGEIIALSPPSLLVSIDVQEYEPSLLGAAGGPYMLTLAPAVPLPVYFGDFNKDGHIESYDYFILNLCMSTSGPAVSAPFQECRTSFDWDDDADVDLRDFSIFMLSFHEQPN